MNISNNIGDTLHIDGAWKYLPVAEIYEDKIYTYSQNSSIKDREASKLKCDGCQLYQRQSIIKNFRFLKYLKSLV